MRIIRTERDIDAPPAAVWDVLTDVEAYPEWNPHVVATDGTLAAGERLRLTVRTDGRERTIPVRVTAFDPPNRLEWVGRVGHRAVFEGRHAFELTPLNGDRTRLRNREQVSGALARFVVPDGVESNYRGMNDALAGRVEAHEREKGDGAPGGRESEG